MKFVVDASVVIKWLLPESYSDESMALLEAGHPIYVADMVLVQVGQALARRTKTGELKPQWIEDAMRTLTLLPLHVIPTAELATEAASLAGQGKRTYSDAINLALAVREGVPLVTADWRWYSLVINGPLKPYVRFVRDALG